MENNYNIEEIFKSNLQNLEATPPVGGWEAIAAKMNLAGNTAAATATVAKTGLGFAKIAAIITVAVGTGLGVGYFAFKDDTKTNEERTTKNEQHASETSLNVPVTIPDNIELTELSSVNKNGKVVSIVEVKKGNETQKVLVEFTQTDQNNNHSIVGQWLSNDKNKYSQDLINKLVQQLETGDSETAVSTENNSATSSDVKVQKLEENDVIAGIKASVWSGNAPLSVDFSNLTGADEYDWNFGDNNTSKDNSPRHTYNEPGNYVVVLTVKNSAGKTKTDKVLIEVNAKEEIAIEESSIKTFNIFTPNGDGKNDEFVFESSNIESFQVQVIDQNGKIVYSSTDVNQTWNGQDKNGDQLPKGTYTCSYKATGKDKKEYKKTFALQLNR